MTLDQIFMLLADEKVLRADTKVRRVKESSLQVVPKADKDGYIRGRDKDGKPMKAKIGIEGKSWARRLMEEEQARLKEEKKKKRNGR